MDFPGDAITNISAINGFSVIHWRIYTEETAAGNPTPEIIPTNGYNILRHLSRLKDLEIQLRNFDCLVSCYPRRLGLWIFSPTPGFESLTPLARDSTAQDPKESTKLSIGASSLKVSASGSITAADLIRSLSVDGVASGGGNPGNARPPGSGPNGTRSNDTHGNSIAIYASFMTAVAGVIGLQLIKRLNAIPLGARTFFTAIERSFYDNWTIADANTDSIPALTTLKIELAQAGKIIVALHTVYQDGISRLLRPGSKDFNLTDVQPNMDVWLAPNGTVARLITVNTTQSTVFAPKQAKNEAAARQITEAKQKVWKLTVLEWINNIGLSVNSSEEEHWVEVEVSEPFYARLAVEHLRQMDDGQSSSPLKRILWPSKYCFRRTKTTSSGLADKIHNLTNNGEDPLHFAESWLETATLRHDKPADGASNVQEMGQEKNIPSTKPDVPEKIESLARVVHYPDLQNASAVYPTPPDGALGAGINQTSTDTLGIDGQDVAMMRNSARGASVKQQGDARKGSEENIALGNLNGLEVGSGLYDTNDDDELFSGINDKDFGTKGITDADFSFFDDNDDEMSGFMVDKPEIEHPQEDLQQLSPGQNINNQPKKENAEQIASKDEPSEQKVEIHSLNPADLPPEFEASTKQPNAGFGNISMKDEEISDLSDQDRSAPLSPIEVKEMIFSKKETQKPQDIKQNSVLPILGSERKQSRYNAISFKRGLTLSDQKYTSAGRFFFTAKKDKPEPVSSVPEIPIIGLPGWHRQRPRAAVKEKTKDSHDINSEQPMQGVDSVSSDETSCDSSDEDSEDELTVARLSTLKRKRPLSEAEKSTTSSMEKLSITSEVDGHISKEDTAIFLGNFFSTFTDWSLVGYFSTKQSQNIFSASRKEDQMQIAQLMADQLTQSSLSHNIDGWESIADIENEFISLHTFLEDVPIVGEIERLDLKTYATLHDGPQNVAETPSTRPNPQRREVKGSITKIAPAHLRIHRGRDFLEVLPTSMPFWETFGLEPASGQKDISAYCICPRFATEEGDAFITRLGLVYSSCNLGKHVRGDKSKLFENGLGLWDIVKGDGSYGETMQSLRNLCENLGTALSKSPPARENFVIYIINPFTHGAAFVDICSIFLQLFNKYINDVDKNYSKNQLNELILQIVPLDFVFSPMSLVVPTQSQYLNLALEVYSRCPPKDVNSSVIDCAPPVVLAESTPKMINFKVTSERFSPFQEGRCLHVAISRSADQRWISVAWSDNTGSSQISMSYCVRTRGSNVNRIISEVRQEIWEATKDLMERTQIRWKVFLVRTEPIDQEEIDAWTGLVERYNQTKASPVELTLFSANIIPGLRLEIPAGQFQANAMNPMTSTPVATPYAGISSPDQIGAATPASGGPAASNVNYSSAMTPTETPPVLVEADSDAILIDASEESWTVILSHRLSNSTYITEYKPALVSGYLLRKRGVSDCQGVVAMSLNLIHTSRPSALHEAVLREALLSYRDLATLARAKGTLHVQHNTLPWHIATAVKGQELLSFVF